MSRRATLLTLAISFVVGVADANTAIAQAPKTLRDAMGSRIRVRTKESNVWRTGTLSGIEDQTVVLAQPVGPPQRFVMSEISSAERDLGRDRFRFGLVGFFGGAFGGGLIGYESGRRNVARQSSEAPMHGSQTVEGATAGAVLGAIVGTVAGVLLAPREWEHIWPQCLRATYEHSRYYPIG